MIKDKRIKANEIENVIGYTKLTELKKINSFFSLSQRIDPMLIEYIIEEIQNSDKVTIFKVNNAYKSITKDESIKENSIYRMIKLLNYK